MRVVRSPWFWVFSFLFVFVFPPIAAQLLHGNSSWMGFLSSYSGSIIGGLLGGMITYFGVYAGLHGQSRQKFIDEFPKRLLQIDKFIELLRTALENEAIQLFCNGEDRFINARSAYQYFEDIVEQMREQSADISVELYREARKTREVILEHMGNYQREHGDDVIWASGRVYVDEEIRLRRLQLANVLAQALNDYLKYVWDYRTDLEKKFNGITKS